MSEILIQRLCIIGVGLIGGSLARALRQAGVVGEIVGCGRDTEHLQRALELGVIDRFSTDMAAAVKDADVVVLAVPMGVMQQVFSQIKDHISKTCVLTDVGSVKGHAVTAAEKVFGQSPSNFVPGHPIAGTEKNGVEASFAELFRGRRIILTPTDQSDRAAVSKVRAMWEASGAHVMEMNVQHHDEVLAATSHLPHMLAYALVDTLARMDDSQEIFTYAAGGFRDFTRIASSDPQVWHDICIANQDALLDVMQRFRDDLQLLIDAIGQGDSEFLQQTFTRAKQARDTYTEQN